MITNLAANIAIWSAIYTEKKKKLKNDKLDESPKVLDADQFNNILKWNVIYI